MLHAKTTLSVDGEFITSFTSISLNQSINDHHHFTIVFDQTIKETVGSHTIDKSKNWIGKPVVIGFDEQEFLGIATNLEMVHNDGHDGKLVLSGFSKTILLESGEHTASWLEKPLKDIVTDTIDAAGIEAEVSPIYKDKIEYQSQYMETHFQFLKRLSKQYNEWLFYDGIKLVFGKPSPPAPIKLQYGKDLSNLKLGMQLIPSTQNVFTYNSLDDKQEEAVSKDDPAGLSELGMHAFTTTKEMFKIVPNRFAPPRVSNKSQLDGLLKKSQDRAISQINTLSAVCNKQGLTVGSVVKISSAKYDKQAFDVQNYGEFLITSISHTANDNAEYRCSFTALPSGIEVLPAPEVLSPNAQPQIATVFSNEDPKKKGRVQVKFQWQKNQMKTSWLRVMTPDAGMSDKVPTNRGFVFIPEEGDTVMVGFRYNDPNRPFVMGSMFNGTTGAGGSDLNKIKSLTTRSGSTITLDEEKGNIHIADAKQNSMTFDGEGNISISSSASITLSTGESCLSMKSDGTIDLTGINITISGSDTVTEMSKSITHDGSDIVSINSPKMVSVNSDKEVMINGLAKATVTSSATTAISGTIIKLN